MIPKLKNIANNATSVIINDIELFFSYETCIGFYDHNTDKGYQTEKSYSRTTAKHRTLMGIKNYEVLSDETMLKQLEEALKGSLNDA